MRITRFDLLRYGKFTDKSVSLPRADKDFHLVIGPNEAGKSTLRSAIQDLLFGIETRSRYNFLHPHSEMRLGALIEQGNSQLDFIRTKARTKTLQTVSSSPLPDNALTPYLGPVDRVFFDQMFGLNHERLVTDGQEILSASNDIGQILFQAAAGIGSLGDIRDRLELEADKLWAKRKSSDREYYLASAELDQAEAALKQATVRTKDWQEARTKGDQIGEELGRARARYQALEQERIALEQVRRVAPLLTTLAGPERQLAELGEVVSLPENAAEQLAQAEHEGAIASQALILFEKQAAELQEKIAVLHPAESILVRGTDIDALSGMRQQLRNFEGDIGKREDEVRVLWQAVEESTRQLGWPQKSEEEVAQRLPGSLVRSAIDNLIRRHETLTQALSTAEENLRSRDEEVKAIHAEIAAMPATAIPVTLTAALASARSLGDAVAQEKRGATQIGRLRCELEAMVLELGEWSPGLDGLRELLPPTGDETNSLIRRRNDLELTASTLGGRLAEVNAEVQSLMLEISQYKAANQPVTLENVQQVRSSRDSTWQAIKTGMTLLKEATTDYEQEVALADSLSDKRHDKAQEETELQSRLDRLQRLQQQVADLDQRLLKNTQTLADFDQTWDLRVKALGLAGMPLLRVNDWRSARERVLGAADALAEAQSLQDDFAVSVAQTGTALTQAMLAIQPEVKNLNLSALIKKGKPPALPGDSRSLTFT